MKKIIVGIVSLLFLSSPTLRGQEPRLEDILLKYYQSSAIAGEKTWETIVLEGKTIGQDSEYPYRVFLKRPGRIRTEFEIQGTKMIQVWDGKKGWSIVPWSGSLDPQDMTADESKDLREQADFEGALYNWKEKGFRTRLIGREDLEGTPVYNIELSRPGGDKENYYIDAENFLLLKVAFHVMVMGHILEHEKYLANYRQVEGVLLPFAITEKYPGPNQQGGNQVVYDHIVVNQPLNDSLFVKPLNK